METTIKCHICKTTNSEHLINIRENMYECKACDSIFFHIDDLEIQHQLYSARDYSSTYDFDKADEIYNKVLNETDSIKTKVMCYHGKLLAEFEVNYIKGYKKDSNRMVVTFSNYDKNKTSIKESYYYKALMNLPLTADEKEKYETSIDELDASYHKIPEELQKTPEYDVFICVKISPKVNDDDNTSNLTNTKDSCIAEQIYNNLTSRGVKVFYSDVVRGYIGDDSEIISALLKSRMMLIICGATEFIESRWVQSEWRRWVNLINQGERDKNSLILLSTQEFTKPKLLKNIIEYELHEQLKLLDLLEERSKGSKKDSLTKEQKNPPMQNMDDSKNQDHLESMATKKESPIEDFEIKNGVLKKYKGRDNEVIIPEGVTSIGKNAFTPIDDFSANLISIVIPSSVRSIEIYAFVGCDRLVEVYNLSSLTITLGSSNNGLIGRYAKVIHTSLNEPSQLIKKR